MKNIQNTPTPREGIGYVVDEDNRTTSTTIIGFRKRRNYSGRWFSIHKNDLDNKGLSLKNLAVNKDLKQTDYRVLHWLLEEIGPLNMYVDIPQYQISKDLKVDTAHISRSVKHLVELIILLCEGVKNKKKYRFNPAFCFSSGVEAAMAEKRKYIASQSQSVPWLN